MTALSIKGKLSLATVAASGLALVLASCAFLAIDYAHQRWTLLQHIASVADIVAYNSAAALEFEDERGAAEVLSALRLRDHISGARIYRRDGRPFADYRRPNGAALKLPPTAPATGVALTDRHLVAVRAIRIGDESIGTLYIASERAELDQALVGKLKIAGGVLLTCVAVAFLLGLGIHGAIAKPILALAEAAKRVTEHNDYSVRAVGESGDELGRLVRDFNRMLERIEEVSAAKSNFLCNMSHEIRTPLTAILGFAEELEHCGGVQSDVGARESLETIQRNGEHLLAVINDILDLSKIEAGRLEVERLRFPPLKVVAQIVRSFSVRAELKQLDFRVEYTGPIPETMLGDPIRTNQVLLNLVGNAFKFTPEGGRVTLRIGLLRESHSGVMTFEIEDTGIGIGKEHLARLFQPFEQADNTTTRRFGGTGLGLSISKRLCELMGGNISVESEPEEGSRFRVELPTGSLEEVRMVRDPQAWSPEADTVASAATSEPVRLDCAILLVEDAPDNQRLIAHVLRRAGAAVQIAENGQVALERVAGAAEPFDLILMDMQMPVMDGYEASRRLRDRAYAGPIIALTAHAMQGEKERCISAGCDDFASKPIEWNRLLPLIRDLVAKA